MSVAKLVHFPEPPDPDSIAPAAVDKRQGHFLWHSAL
jgi:hypothetical protein